VVLNFWSTWCKPCIDELPHFIEVTRQLDSAGVQLWLVSQDTRSLFQSGALKDFITKKQWNARHFWLDETDADYYCPLIDSTWSGAIPATLICNVRTGYRAFYEASLSKQALLDAINKAMH
jgi:thiol-disulfide isomerase/thioredoxin